MEGKKKRIDTGVVSLQNPVKGSGNREVLLFETTSFDVGRWTKSKILKFQPKYRKEGKFHLRRRSSLIRGGSVKFSGGNTRAGVASIFESPGAPSPSGTIGGVRAREKTRALPSFPALTCRPFFFVPPAYRARFFKATHVLSMCDMPLKRHEADRGRHASTLHVRIYAQPVPYINVYTGVSPKKRTKEREREKEIRKVTFYLDFLSKNMEPTFFLLKTSRA